jgi:exodeoxyribonuclease VII large subunit
MARPQPSRHAFSEWSGTGGATWDSSAGPPPIADRIPRYTISELNRSIGTLLNEGFAPRFVLDATVSRPQQRKGHLWMTLTDGEASISAVVWASQLRKLSFIPEEGDGVVVVGTINFWTARASLSVQVLDLRPGLTAVLRQFERVRSRLEPEGLFDPARKRPLPQWPERIALLTSVPSSALADMLRTARERWPPSQVLLVPIPVQGQVEGTISDTLQTLARQVDVLAIDAVVLARGGGSREDLAVFDGEQLARVLAAFPIPVVCGLGHEDDVTIADLVADHRAATPTAALVALLPERTEALRWVEQSTAQMRQMIRYRLDTARQQFQTLRMQLDHLHPSRWLEHQREWLLQQRRLLQALSPQHLLERGFSLVRDPEGRVVRSIRSLQPGKTITVQLRDGEISATITAVLPEEEGSPSLPKGTGTPSTRQR